MLIRYRDGRTKQGILLALDGTLMRVAVKSEDDVVEFRLLKDVWICEDCEPVTFEFPVAVFEAIGIMPKDPVDDSYTGVYDAVEASTPYAMN